MASTYTVNLGIEKIGTGEQSGTWGTTTNTNFDLIDQAVNGAVTVTLASAGTSGSPNSLVITNGAASDGRNKFIEFNDGGDLGATAYVQLDPNDAEKIVHMRNSLSGGRSVIVFQGTYNASNDFEIPNGKDVVLKFDGAGASATVTDVFTDLQATAITTPDLTATTADINGGTIDGATIGGASAGAGTFTNLTASGTVSFSGATVSDGGTVTTVDINGGTIDGATLGGSSQVTITDADMNGGSIDGTIIGAASPAAGTFTTVTGTGFASTGDMTFGDNDKAIFGAGSDLQIFHDGSNSYISEEGTGVLAIQSNGDFTVIQNAVGTANAVFRNSGASELYDNGSLKLATTATGIDVTGTVTADGLTVAAAGTTTVSIAPSSAGTAQLTMSGTGGGAAQITSSENGMYFTNTDTGAFIYTSNSTEKMRLDGSGNVGIGTSSPAYKLDVSGQIRAAVADGNAQIRLERTGTSAGSSWLGANDSWLLGVLDSGFTSHLILDTSGNLGLGVTPSAWTTFKALQLPGGALASVSGQTAVLSNTYFDGAFRYTATGVASSYADQFSGAHRWFTAPSGTAGNTISFTQAMTLDASGNLGIGTTSPESLLHIAKSVSGGKVTAYIDNTAAAAANNAASVKFSVDGGASVSNGGAEIEALIADTVNGSTDLLFKTYNGAAYGERARITSAGNVGIGTTSPASLLHIENSAGGSGGYAKFTDVTHGGDVRFGMADGVDNNAVSGAFSNNDYLFYTNSLERMRIDSSGNLLVGTTSNTENAKLFVSYPYSASGGSAVIGTEVDNTGTIRAIAFRNPNGLVGTITTSGSATAYNTSSDYRLKNVDGPITNSGAYIDALKPVQGSWKADGSRFIGLIAHEVQEVSETQIATGEKDGEEMQAMDYSSPELIANLIAEIQSLRARVHALESK